MNDDKRTHISNFERDEPMKTRKLTKGETYDLDTLTPAGWSGEATEGYSCWDYFDSDGVYLGADEDGIEPLFRDYLRPATQAERDASRKAGDEGVIAVDGRSCYVQE